jgi:hypothetical protein
MGINFWSASSYFRKNHAGRFYICIMAVLKNVQFSKLIKAEGRLREFNFRKSNGIAGAVYHVDVSDDRGNRYYLTLLSVDNVWTVQEENLPPWIVEAVPQFNPAIQEQEA